MKFAIIFFAFIFVLCSLAFAALPPELVLYMPFENNTIKADEVQDLTNYKNHGTIKGDPKVVKGFRGDALDFSNDTVEIPISASLSKTKSAITMEAWVFARALTLGEIISRWDGQLNGITHFELRDGGGMRYCMRNEADASFIDFTSAEVISANKWVHIALTYDGATARIYFDGVEVGNRAGASSMRDNENVNLWIGSMYGTDRWFNGIIDEVCIWSKALTPDEIKKSIEGKLISMSVEKSGKLATAWGNIKKD